MSCRLPQEPLLLYGTTSGSITYVTIPIAIKPKRAGTCTSMQRRAREGAALAPGAWVCQATSTEHGLHTNRSAHASTHGPPPVTGRTNRSAHGPPSCHTHGPHEQISSRPTPLSRAAPTDQLTARPLSKCIEPSVCKCDQLHRTHVNVWQCKPLRANMCT